jgi:pyrroline-5-carboxylate reductase
VTKASQRIVILGAGVMGQALGIGITRSTNATVLIVEADPQRAEQAAALLGVQAVSLSEAAAEPATFIIAVKPQQIDAALEQLAAVMKPESIAISVAAGVGTERLQEALPEADIVRAMPNTPARIEEGVIGICAGGRTTAAAMQVAEQMLSTVGTVVTVSEADMDAVTAISGSGPAYVFYLAEAMLDAARSFGLDDDVARAMVAQTVLGAGALLAEADPATLRAQVTSPGGTTEAAIGVLDAAGAQVLIRRAITAARDRSREL